MTPRNPRDALRDMAERLERRLEIVRGIEELARSDPALADELVAALGGKRDKQNGSPPKKLTHFERIIRFFEKNGNKWASVNEVADGAGLPRGAIGFTFYKAHKARFEKRDSPPGRGRTKLWRVKGGIS